MPLNGSVLDSAAIGGGLEYDLYIEEVAQEIGLPAEKIRSAVQAAKRKPKTAQSDGPPPHPSHPQRCLPATFRRSKMDYHRSSMKALAGHACL